MPPLEVLWCGKMHRGLIISCPQQHRQLKRKGFYPILSFLSIQAGRIDENDLSYSSSKIVSFISGKSKSSETGWLIYGLSDALSAGTNSSKSSIRHSKTVHRRASTAVSNRVIVLLQ